MPGAGDLRRKVMIQRATEVQDSAGQPIKTWADWRPKWARRKAISGREAIAAQQIVAMADCEYVVRDDSDTRQITAHELYRLVDRARVYDIVSPEPSDKPGWITLRVRGRAEVAA